MTRETVTMLGALRLKLSKWTWMPAACLRRQLAAVHRQPGEKTEDCPYCALLEVAVPDAFQHSEVSEQCSAASIQVCRHCRSS